MPVTTITTNATTLCKQGAGYLLGLNIAVVGTSWTLKIQDGPDSAGNFKNILGSTAVPVPALGTELIPVPIFFGQGLTVITASGGPAGELDVVWS